ncbi:GNAT family N-acetyltransferase [Okibacterium fritillariae]|uniref:Acetyltransferase (GNAT) family protein n=1 Tax=Okibacterium fritillariae TaxID=123320 RepID=A0A1T5II48_9MICO|nr:GNAT family N-acetyltransferase [Okibacterium fritillariae]SKC38693.1 Acetyltransferase (GNAT) family protein [Okibacterium fritillariae]
MSTSIPAPASFTLENVDWNDPRAVALRAEMEAEMDERYGSSHGDEPVEVTEARMRALAVDPAGVVRTILAVDAGGTPIGHVGVRWLNGVLEVKRLIVTGGQRGQGLGRALMAAVEDVARAEDETHIILQTGTKQPEAVALYERIGYRAIPVYEPYRETMPWSLCYEKFLDAV